ncbi:hypothetical protein OSTOST_25204, partial [Ostertagia ostertagi]
MQWWDDLWLSESFASYMEFIALDAVRKGASKLKDLFVVDKLEPALGLDSFPASHPLYFELNNPSDVMEVFNPVTYDKGASLIAMIIALMGEKNFEKGVKVAFVALTLGGFFFKFFLALLSHEFQRFLKNYSYGNADSEDFWDALENAGSKTKGPNGEALNISEFAAQWTTQ